jgi:two-component system OmpR family sensor kinase
MTGRGRRLLRAPRAASVRLRRVGARAPLRVKLVATLLLLLVGALLGSGLAARATLQSYLIGRVDDQLASVARHPDLGHDDGSTASRADAGSTGSEPDDGTGDDPHDRLPSDFVVEITDATGQIVYGPTSNLIDSAAALPALPSLTAAETEDRGRHTFTVGADGGGGQWRVLAQPTALTDGTTGTLLIAQSLADVRNTVDRLTLLLVVIGGIAVVVFAGVGYVVVRASLRPLREVERTAAAIAGGDLTRRVADSDPRTEIGQLSGALNTMLGEIESAFAQRAASEAAARRSEEQMRVSESAARRSEERMRRFVADASHELRTPLTSIRGFAELYRHGLGKGEVDVGRLMGRIEDEAKRMGLLVEDLLLLARMDQQRPFAEAPVDLLALATDAVHDAQALAPDRRITLEVGPTDPPPIVTGDEARLRQVLANLLGNARQHTPAGTPVTVRVSTTPAAEPGGASVVLEVADEGPGMTGETAARVFERFYRADASRNRSDGGTGLGLAIVAALVAGHGGTVKVRTAPGAGACFRIELPLAARTGGG